MCNFSYISEIVIYKFISNYNVGDVVDVTIDGMSTFGAFAVIIPGVKGLIHISQIANKRVDNVADVLTVGQEVECKITEIDLDKKRISLSIRALLPEEEFDDAADETIEEAPEAEETAEETTDAE